MIVYQLCLADMSLYDTQFNTMLLLLLYSVVWGKFTVIENSMFKYFQCVSSQLFLARHRQKLTENFSQITVIVVH